MFMLKQKSKCPMIEQQIINDRINMIKYIHDKITNISRS